jgi:hypothetical protein
VSDGPNQAVLSIPMPVKKALERLREDLGYPTYGDLIRQLIEAKYPGRSEI